MEQSQPIMQPVPCPVCGSAPHYRIWSQTIGHYSVILDSKKHPFNGSEAKPLVCTVCGYVQLFVNPEDFRD